MKTKVKARWALMAAFCAAALPIAAFAAGYWTNGVPVVGVSPYSSTLPLTGNETLPADTNLAGGVQPQSVAVTTSHLAAFVQNVPFRNYLDNGAMSITQRGVASATTCGTNTAPTQSAFGADRWACDANVASGAGRMQVVTASPAPPTGFAQSMTMWRNSGALTQPICAMQAIESTRSVQLAGKQVMLSAYLQALAGLTSTGGAVQVYVITGTGTDQGFGTLTASPAITPAWTGLSGGTTPSATWTATTSWVRNNTTPISIPSTATEIGVMICFTPVSSSSGTTDGIAFTGVQLEVIGPTATAVPSTYEFKPTGIELLQAQRFFWQLNEPANGAQVPGACQATGATAGICFVNLPVAMRGTTPVVAIPTTGTFKVNIAGTPTTWVTPTAGVCGVLSCNITIGNTNTAGQMLNLTGGGGAGVVTVANDVIM